MEGFLENYQKEKNWTFLKQLSGCFCRLSRVARCKMQSNQIHGLNHLWVACRLAFEFKFNCIIQIVRNHCYNEGCALLLSGYVGLR